MPGFRSIHCITAQRIDGADQVVRDAEAPTTSLQVGYHARQRVRPRAIDFRSAPGIIDFRSKATEMTL